MSRKVEKTKARKTAAENGHSMPHRGSDLLDNGGPSLPRESPLPKWAALLSCWFTQRYAVLVVGPGSAAVVREALSREGLTESRGEGEASIWRDGEGKPVAFAGPLLCDGIASALRSKATRVWAWVNPVPYHPRMEQIEAKLTLP